MQQIGRPFGAEYARDIPFAGKKQNGERKWAFYVDAEGGVLAKSDNKSMKLNWPVIVDLHHTAKGLLRANIAVPNGFQKNIEYCTTRENRNYFAEGDAPMNKAANWFNKPPDGGFWTLKLLEGVTHYTSFDAITEDLQSQLQKMVKAFDVAKYRFDHNLVGIEDQHGQKTVVYFGFGQIRDIGQGYIPIWALGPNGEGKIEQPNTYVMQDTRRRQAGQPALLDLQEIKRRATEDAHTYPSYGDYTLDTLEQQFALTLWAGARIFPEWPDEHKQWLEQPAYATYTWQTKRTGRLIPIAPIVPWVKGLEKNAQELAMLVRELHPPKRHKPGVSNGGGKLTITPESDDDSDDEEANAFIDLTIR